MGHYHALHLPTVGDVAFGIRGAELRDLLQKEIPDELGHATFLTDVIVDLGGEPVLGDPSRSNWCM